MVLATRGRDGLLDLSPRGDPAGFVEVLDEHTLAIPDRLGNNRVDSFENLLFDDAGGPRAGYVLNYLRQRAEFIPHDGALENQIMSLERFDAVAQIADLLARIDWTQLVGGVAVATLLVYIASEYRRRMIIA